MKYVLARHPSPDIAAGVCYGRLDVALRLDALSDLPELAMRIARHGVARIWSSPATRCRGLADAAAAAAGVAVRFDERLRELDFGAWEGQRWDSVPRAELDRWAAAPHDFAPPGGESGAALLARVIAVHRAIADAGEDCAIVSHGGPLKLLAALIRGVPPDLLAPAPAIGSVTVLRA